MPSIKDADGREYPAELHLIEWQAETKRMLYLCSENGFPLDQVETRFHVPSFSFSAYLKSPYIAALHNDGQLGLAGMVPELREALEGARNAIKEHFRERAVQRARSVVEPLAGRAQQTAVRLVGFLCSGTAEGYRGPLATFRQALNESGYYEGRNVMIEFRFAENQYDRLPALARDLVQRRVDVIVAAGAVTGIGSLPLTSVTSAVRAVAEFSPEVPFWPQLPQLSQQESIVGQGLGVVEELIEPRNEGYGYQVKEGRLDSVLEILHRSSGELTPAHAAGFGAFEEALSSGLFGSAIAVKGQIEGPITLSAYLFHKGRHFLCSNGKRGFMRAVNHFTERKRKQEFEGVNVKQHDKK